MKLFYRFFSLLVRGHVASCGINSLTFHIFLSFNALSSTFLVRKQIVPIYHDNIVNMLFSQLANDFEMSIHVRGQSLFSHQYLGSQLSNKDMIRKSCE